VTRSRAALTVLALAAPVLLGAQGRAGDPTIPAGFQPPPGLCRIWVQGVPADKQPAPTDCASALKNSPPNGRVIFGPSADSTRQPGAAQLLRTRGLPLPAALAPTRLAPVPSRLASDSAARRDAGKARDSAARRPADRGRDSAATRDSAAAARRDSAARRVPPSDTQSRPLRD